MARMLRGRGWVGRLAALAVAVGAVIVLVLVLSAVRLLPQLRNPFTETTTERSGPVVLKSITELSRYEAASGSFQVVVDLTKSTSFLPSFIAGSQTLFVGDGTDIAYVDFAGLKGPDLRVSKNRTAVTVSLPQPQLDPAVLNTKQSYVFAQQQGLVNRLDNFFGGNPNSQQAVYISDQRHIEAAARRSPLLADARQNTQAMLTGMLGALCFRHITVKW